MTNHERGSVRRGMCLLAEGSWRLKFYKTEEYHFNQSRKNMIQNTQLSILPVQRSIFPFS